MAQAQNPDDTDLEQKILQLLRDAGSPMKAAKLAKHCQVTKKQLNQALYRMKDSKVTLSADATWSLAEDGPRNPVLSEQTQPSPEKNIAPQEVNAAVVPYSGGAAGLEVTPAERPQQNALAIPGSLRHPLSERQKEIYRLLEARGPLRALHIAQALGMRTAKDVNPDLYALRKLHLLDLDPDSKMWAIYQPEQSGGTNPATTIIVQKNPINMISQNGPQSGIYIQNCADLQIGHGNIIMKQEGPGAMAPHHPPPPQNPPPGTRGSQNIHVEKSVLQRVQLGHANLMRIHSAAPGDPAHGAWSSPPASATTAAPEASFEIPLSQEGPAAEGVAAQRVHIRECSLENVAIGNSNSMTISPGPARPEGAPGPGDGKRGSGEPGEDAGLSPPDSEDAQGLGIQAWSQLLGPACSALGFESLALQGTVMPPSEAGTALTTQVGVSAHLRRS
ncbi:Z-DNA-binding protein 1 [Talpa occidentalis]|uniref:Z-DNA-binding protein 1 n=1 Tax=Talpa occidentalis TaxID=50954 RepID=UPI00188F96DA|nr:Z-DNA-binding protein 1 [Talpa occidentalis]